MEYQAPYKFRWQTAALCKGDSFSEASSRYDIGSQGIGAHKHEAQGFVGPILHEWHVHSVVRRQHAARRWNVILPQSAYLDTLQITQ